MTVLQELLERRTAAMAALEAHDTPIFAENRSLTPEEETKHGELRGVVLALDSRIVELDDDAVRDTRVAEARARSGVPTANAGAAVVHAEPSIYGEGTGQSYYADLCWSAMPGDPHYRDAQERMLQYGRNVVRDCVNNPEERKRVARAAREQYRKDTVRGRQFVDDLASRSLEVRAMDTTTGSGGSFVTPVYLVGDYAPYRTGGRSFINETNLQDLPEYGMTVYLPAIQAAAGISAQTQGAGVTETDPTAGYLSSNLTTEAGQVTISQQLLDRAGPGVQFDKIIFDQLNREYDTAIDLAVLTSALANAGTVADAHTTATSLAVIQDFYSDVAVAMSQMETAPGTVLSATHTFVQNVEWAFLSSQLDGNGRPLIVPSAGMPYNAIAAAISGKENVVPEGATGYEVQSVPVFKDLVIPTTNSGADTQIVVAHMPEVWVWEGTPIPRTIPQTYAQNLQVLLQQYSYWTCIVRYPKAVQSISGARYPVAPAFTYA